MRKSKFVCSVALGAVAAWSMPAFAQASPASGDAADGEIIVTAQKRSERLSDVPMAIKAMTGDQLQSAGVESVQDLVKIVPGLTVSTTYADTPVYTIRGVGFYENSLAVTPAVSVYQDQVPLPYAVMTEGVAFDVGRVEVLKGPQGSLFGQNATGGAINYIPNQPTQELSVGGRLGYGNYNAIHADGHVSGRLGEGVAARLAGTYDSRNGWQRSVSRPNDTNGEIDFLAGRFLLDLQPTDTLKLQFNANGWRNKSDSQTWQFRDIRPTAGYAVPLNALAAYRTQFGFAPNNATAADWDAGLNLARDDHFYQFALKAELDGGPVQVTSISSYSKYHRNSIADPDGTPYPDALTQQIGDIESLSQELRFSGEGFDHRLEWMLGANYSHDKSNENTIANNRGSNGATPFGVFFGLNQINNQTIDTLGVFGSLGYDLTDQLKLQGSIRYTSSKDKFSGCVADVNGTLATVFSGIATVVYGHPTVIQQGQCVTLLAGGFPSITPIGRNLNEDNVSWRTSLSWKPTSDTLAYVSASRGYKAGSFASLPAAAESQLIPVPQESVLAFEVGLKQRLGGIADLEIAAFHYDYSDKQLRGTVDVPPLFSAIPALVSVPKSKVQGVEASISVRPLAGLTLGLAGTYVDSEVTSSYVTKDPQGVTVNIQGNAFPYTPKWQWTANAQYEFPVGGNLSAFVGGSARHQSVSRSGFGSNPDYNIPAFTVLDLRAGISGPDDRWRVEVWGRNVTDKYYLNNVVRVVDTLATLAGMPATYGVTVGFKF